MTTDLELRLGDLGDRLDVDTDLVDSVLSQLAGATRSRRRRRSPGLVAAGLLLVVAAAVVAIPSSRRTIADWFGLDRVQIERQPDLSVPSEPDPIDTLPAEAPSFTIVTVDEREIVVTEIDATITDGFISKSVGADTSVVRVDVGGHPGVWIAGEPHDVLIEVDGEPVLRRFAGNTLLWQDDAVLRRLEGFDSLDEALAYATR